MNPETSNKAERQTQENQTRADRFRKGLLGLWDWVTGRRATTREQNEAELAESLKRDQAQQHSLVERHLSERRELHRQIKAMRYRFEAEQSSFQGSGAALKPEQDRLHESSPLSLKGRMRPTIDI